VGGAPPAGQCALHQFAAADSRELGAEPDARLPTMPLGEHVVADHQTLRLSLKALPMVILRAQAARSLREMTKPAHHPFGLRVGAADLRPMCAASRGIERIGQHRPPYGLSLGGAVLGALQVRRHWTLGQADALFQRDSSGSTARASQGGPRDHAEGGEGV
jgi:hypothetical protein